MRQKIYIVRFRDGRNVTFHRETNMIVYLNDIDATTYRIETIYLGVSK